MLYFMLFNNPLVLYVMNLQTPVLLQLLQYMGSWIIKATGKRAEEYISSFPKPSLAGAISL